MDDSFLYELNFAQKPFWYELNELQFYEMKTQWNFG